MDFCKVQTIDGNDLNLPITNPEATDAEALRYEVAALKDKLARLSEASIRVSENLDTEAVLQEVVNSA